MKKAEEYLKEKGMCNVGHYGLLITDPSKQKMHQIMEDYAKQYAKEAIKADRENVAEHASLVAYFEEWEGDELKMDDDDNLDAHYKNPYLGAGRIIAIYKDSIINAPNIELL